MSTRKYAKPKLTKLDPDSDYLIEGAIKMACKKFDCERDDVAYTVLSTSLGGHYVRVGCLWCRLELHGYDGSSIPFIVDHAVTLDRIGTVNDYLVYPSDTYKVLAGKCSKCGKITVGMIPILQGEYK